MGWLKCCSIPPPQRCLSTAYQANRLAVLPIMVYFISGILDNKYYEPPASSRSSSLTSCVTSNISKFIQFVIHFTTNHVIGILGGLSMISPTTTIKGIIMKICLFHQSVVATTTTTSTLPLPPCTCEMGFLDSQLISMEQNFPNYFPAH